MGQQTILKEYPKKIVSLAPNITEMIYSLGRGGLLKGNTIYCDYPQEAKRVEKVGDLVTVDAEKILMIKPDLILMTAEGNTKEMADKLRALGFQLFVSNPRNYPGIKKAYLDLGKLLNAGDKAKNDIKAWDTEILDAKRIAALSGKETAMFLIDANPIMLAGDNTFLGELMRLLGLKNLAAGLRSNYPVFSREEILRLDPDYIFYPSDGSKDLDRLTEIYPEWSRLKAIRKNHVLFLNRDLFSRPGPRFSQAALSLAHSIASIRRFAR